jgi:hypothetical protein
MIGSWRLLWVQNVGTGRGGNEIHTEFVSKVVAERPFVSWVGGSDILNIKMSLKE